MKQTINSSETLEGIVTIPGFPPPLKKILHYISSTQERNETTLIESLRAQNAYAVWNAALLAINPVITLKDKKQIQFSQACEEKSLLKDMKSLDLEVDKDGFLVFDKVANTPSDLPIVSVTVYIKQKKGKIETLRIAATGVSKKPFVLFDPTEELAGKKLDQETILALKNGFTNQVKPQSSHMGSAAYRKAMLAVLVEKILETYLHGE